MPASKCQFASILLQDSPVNHLMRSFANGRIAQTYLFCGKESTGRMPVALAFAALLQCQQPISLENGLVDACGSCDSCRRIAGSSHPDVIVVTPDGYEIRIDQVRSLQETASLKPNNGLWQVFVLDPADRLNVSSANSLLKILEEAPSHAVFILLTRDTGAVLPTVLSRCEVVRFASPSHQQAREVLISRFGQSAETAARCYALSEGRFGQALELAANFSEFHMPAGIRQSHAEYLIELEAMGQKLQDEFSGAQNMDAALRLAGRLNRGCFVPLQMARKEFCRSLVMTAGLPAAFSLLFSEQLLDRLDQVTRYMKKSLDIQLADAKKAYSAALFKELDGQIDSSLGQWSDNQIEEFFFCLINWYSDAMIMAAGGDETLLLNLDRKEDIITLAEVDGLSLLRARIETLESSVGLLRRHVQPMLILENVITQIGGPEA